MSAASVAETLGIAESAVTNPADIVSLAWLEFGKTHNREQRREIATYTRKYLVAYFDANIPDRYQGELVEMELICEV